MAHDFSSGKRKAGVASLRRADGFCVVWVTVPSRAVARRLARAALEARLVACANLVPGLESHYWWRGRLERAGEVLVIFKTRRRMLAQLARCILPVHPYDTAEFLALPLVAGSGRYLTWLADAVQPVRKSRPPARARRRAAES